LYGSSLQLDLVPSAFNQRVLCNFWIGVLIEIFGLKSSLLHPLLQDKLLSNGSSSIPGFHRWSLFTPPLPGASESFSTQSACGFHVCFLHFNSWRIQMTPVCPVDERPPLGGAWFSRVSEDGSRPIFFYQSTVVYILQWFLAVFDL
jgi:hypothetical protein